MNYDIKVAQIMFWTDNDFEDKGNCVRKHSLN